MSDLRPVGTSTVIGGQEFKFLFTIGTIEKIQKQCNMPLNDVVKNVIARVADGYTEIEKLKKFHEVVAIMISENPGKKITAKSLDGVMNPKQMMEVAWNLLEAYGISMPEPPEEEDDPEDEDPNQETGL